MSSRLSDNYNWVNLFVNYSSKRWSPTRILPWGILSPPIIDIDSKYNGRIGWRTKFPTYHKLDSELVKDAVLLFGCSCIWGQGLSRYDQTLGHQLSTLLSRPVINLAYPGTGPEFAIDQSVRWLSNYEVKPWAVVHGWSHYTRWMSYVDDLKFRPSAGTIPPGTTGWDIHRKFQHQGLLWKQLWKHVNQVDFTFFGDVQFVKGWTSDRFIDYRDLAEDGNHPGELTIKQLAEAIRDQLITGKWTWKTHSFIADPNDPTTYQYVVDQYKLKNKND